MKKDAEEPGLLGPPLGTGLFALTGVLMANLLRVPGTNIRDGIFFGAELLSALLYAAQPPEWLGMAVIGGLYCLYGASSASLWERSSAGSCRRDPD